MVQLKQGTKSTQLVYEKFQFHNGTIKTSNKDELI